MLKFSALKFDARALKALALTVYYAARDPRMPNAVRLLAFLVAAYALSPIDLIPDFIPVLGYLDDLILLPLGAALVVRLAPDEVIAAARLRAEQASVKPVSYAAAAGIVVVWLVLGILLARWIFRLVAV